MFVTRDNDNMHCHDNNAAGNDPWLILSHHVRTLLLFALSFCHCSSSPFSLFMSLFVIQLLTPFSRYTVVQKTRHPTIVHNFAKYLPIFKILSPIHSAGNFQWRFHYRCTLLHRCVICFPSVRWPVNRSYPSGSLPILYRYILYSSFAANKLLLLLLLENHSIPVAKL